MIYWTGCLTKPLCEGIIYIIVQQFGKSSQAHSEVSVSTLGLYIQSWVLFSVLAS